MPWYVNGGRRSVTGTTEDYAQLVTFDEAAAKFVNWGCYAGLGIALGPDASGNHRQGVDFDKITANGLDDLAMRVQGLVELSPSGRGLHALGYGRPFYNLTPNKSGIEAYSVARFFTYTGNIIRDRGMTCLADFVEQVLVTRHGGHPEPATAVQRMPDEPQMQSDERVMRSFWNASNAEPFRALWFGDLRQYDNDHSRADQALVTQLAFYTLNDEQLVRLFHASALGQRDKAYRQDYIDGTVARARVLQAPRLARMAAIAAAFGGAR